MAWDRVCYVQVPGTMNQYLRDYQQKGVQFLYSRYSSNAGGVLCDDMGLGKTVQVRCMLVLYPDLPCLFGGSGCM